MTNSSPSLICQSFPWFWVFLYQHIFSLLSHLSKLPRRVVYTHCLHVLSPLASLKPQLSCISLFQWSAFSKGHQWLSIINNWYTQQDFYHSHPSHPPCIERLFFLSVSHGPLLLYHLQMAQEPRNVNIEQRLSWGPLKYISQLKSLPMCQPYSTLVFATDMQIDIGKTSHFFSKFSFNFCELHPSCE